VHLRSRRWNEARIQRRSNAASRSVAYREPDHGSGPGQKRSSKPIGRRGQFAQSNWRSNRHRAKACFEDKIHWGLVPRQFIKTDDGRNCRTAMVGMPRGAMSSSLSKRDSCSDRITKSFGRGHVISRGSMAFKMRSRKPKPFAWSRS